MTASFDESLYSVLNLARVACAADAAELVFADETLPNAVCSATGISPEFDPIGQRPRAAWVDAWQSFDITGPGAEAGFLVVASAQPSLGPEASSALTWAAISVENQLDRMIEHTRLANLSALLVEKQTDLRQMRDALAVSNDELEQFAYIAAHELVSPLRSVAIYAELLSQLVDGDQDMLIANADACAKEIRAGVSLMHNQVQSLLDLSSTRVSTEDAEAVDLTLVANNAVDTLEPQLAEVGAIVEVGDLPLVAARPIPLQSVLANLLSNAIRYRHPDRPLVVRIAFEASDRGRAVITITDNGMGVDGEDLQRIFQLFERGTTATEGSGIGLALTRRILEAFDGSILARASQPVGTTFELQVPLWGVTAEPMSVAPPPDASEPQQPLAS